MFRKGFMIGKERKQIFETAYFLIKPLKYGYWTAAPDRVFF